MPDRPQSNGPAPEPVGVPDAESDQPIRQVFARRLDPSSLARFEAELRDVYFARLQAGEAVAADLESELEQELHAVAADLRLCAAFLRQVAADPEHGTSTARSRGWCLLAAARAVEAEAVAERIEWMLEHTPSAAGPAPPGTWSAATIAREVTV